MHENSFDPPLQLSISFNCNLPLRNDSCCMVPVRKCHCSCRTWILELGNADLAEQLKAVVIMESGLLDQLSHILFVRVDYLFFKLVTSVF